MKKLFSALVLNIFLFSSLVFAHPGRTDSNGGHTCKTRCEKWGLQYGEYHYHNKKKSTPQVKLTSKQQSKDKSKGQ